MTVKTFRMFVDCTFEAENIDHAFNLLWKHFEALANGGLGCDDSPLISSGEFHIAPLLDEGYWNEHNKKLVRFQRPEVEG